jgi:hypothetical protein
MFGWRRQRRLTERARQIGQDMVQLRNICGDKAYGAVISWMIADGYTSLGEHIQGRSYRTTSFTRGEPDTADIVYIVMEDLPSPGKLHFTSEGYENLRGLSVSFIPPTGNILVDVSDTAKFRKVLGRDTIATHDIMLGFPGFENIRISTGLIKDVR